jgi:dTDP-4-amino-4,6-dideoxygalactose transaminase
VPEWRIPLFDLDIGDEEIAAVTEVLRSRWLTMGDRIHEFETSFGRRHHVEHALAVANCTVGLQLAYRAVGIGPGDEVIVPSLTFVATANAVIEAGGTPVFGDIVGEHDLGISPAAVAEMITPRTRAVTAVHYAGYPADMTALRSITTERGIALIEDCAHAPGATHAGQPVGGWGDVGCFSFFSNKNLATGEGGMVTTRDPAIAARLRLLRSHGMTTLTLDRHRGHAFTYDVVEAGYNYRMDEMHAAIGQVQFSKLEEKNRRRRALVKRYRSRLAEIPDLGVPYAERDLDESSCHIMPVVLPEGVDREQLMRYMATERVQTSIHYPPIHQFEYYRTRWSQHRVPETERLAPRLLTLPLYPAMGDESVDDVCSVLSAALRSQATAGAA